MYNLIDNLIKNIKNYKAYISITQCDTSLNIRYTFCDTKLVCVWCIFQNNVFVFFRMFKSHNDTKQLFKDFRHIECEDELRMSETLEKHGTKVIEIIDDVITSIENVDYVFDLLKTTGKMHKNFTGFNPNLFWVSHFNVISFTVQYVTILHKIICRNNSSCNRWHT